MAVVQAGARNRNAAQQDGEANPGGRRSGSRRNTVEEHAFSKYHWETKGRFRKRVVLASVPSFRFSFRENMRTYPRSCFRSGGTCECTLVPVFVPGEHPPKPPFWKTTLLSGINFCTGDFAPPKPEFGAEFWETNFGRPNFGSEFLGRIFSSCISSKRGPKRNSPSRNSPSKIHLPKFSPEIGKNIMQGHLADPSVNP